MPPRRRQFVFAVGLLVAVHAVAFGALWTNGSAPDVPEPRTAAPSAPPKTLLSVAAYNTATIPSTGEVRITHPGNGSIVVRARFAVDPAAGRLYTRITDHRLTASSSVTESYYTGWGRWETVGDSWEYASFREAAYEPSRARFVRPVRFRRLWSAGVSVRDPTVHENGSITITMTQRTDGFDLLSFAGRDATVTYRVVVHKDVPYLATVTADPAGVNDSRDAYVVRIERHPGATVTRPASLPGITPREVLDRLQMGARYG